MCHRFSFDYSVLWLFCLHDILPTNSSIFQRFCSAVSFLTVWAAKKNRSLLSFIFFFFLGGYFGRNGDCLFKLFRGRYVYIYTFHGECSLSIRILYFPIGSFFFSFALSFIFFLYFLLLLLIFKKTKLSNYIYVFSSLILYT